MLRSVPALLGVLSLSALAGEGAAAGAAATEAEARARAEVERELQKMTRSPPPSLEIRFDGIDSGRYSLLEAEFALDGQPLPKKAMAQEKGAVLFFNMVQPGDHVITATLVYQEPRKDDLFGSPGLRFKLPGRFIITAQNGLVMRLRTKVRVNEAAADPKDRLALVATAEPMVVAALEEPGEADGPDQAPTGRWRARAKVTKGEQVKPVPIRNTAR